MNLEVKKWLYDILISIQSIYDFIGEVRLYESYESDKKTRRSVLKLEVEKLLQIANPVDSIKIE